MIREEYLDEDLDALIIEFEGEMEAISSAVTVGEKVRHVLIKHVTGDEDLLKSPISYAASLSRSIRSSGAIAFFTSADVKNYVHITLEKPYEAHIFVTTGLEPAGCLHSERLFAPIASGTMNVIVAVDAPLRREALADLYRTTIEAKVLAASDLYLRCKGRAYGTITDAIAVLKPSDEASTLLTAGSATSLGAAIGVAVYSAIVDRGRRLSDDDILLRNLLGISVQELLDITVRAYDMAPIPGLSAEDARKELEEALDRALKDPNVWSFLVGARELDLHASMGSLPNLSVDEYEADSTKIVADELIGSALALYVAGARGLLSMYWIERIKDKSLREIADKPMFEDDVISAMVGSLLTLLYDGHASDRS